MLFTAGYLWTYYQFGIKKGSKPLTGWADLKGKAVAVNKGTPYETISKAKGTEFGFEVQAYDSQADAVQAVLSGRAYATFVGNTSVQYIAKQTPHVRGRPRAQGREAPLGGAGAEGQSQAARRAPGRARLHEEGRHAW